VIFQIKRALSKLNIEDADISILLFLVFYLLPADFLSKEFEIIYNLLLI